ncbi:MULTISPECIES: serine hydrolase [unclassified Streptomyces]|uniref:serine hydrolase domain-containing protein n=1 Tax=unclassified Streptomyces TaxID=2593676 RepID=UPI00224FA060|nr:MULTISPECIES: serine hydrolase domain-containing protein [unclassified Streptomyces]MCX4406097.1 beta-lactamase family protein [Streptomyces sp. NBC_01764]MCX5189378.1 beta-lactamase family protein [Streptomyces sp. NBC_00268]
MTDDSNVQTHRPVSVPAGVGGAAGPRVTLFSAQWFRYAQQLLSVTQVDEQTAVRFLLKLTDSLELGVVPRVTMLLDRSTDGLRILPEDGATRPNLEITLNSEQAATLLLGNGAQRARLLEEEGITLVGVFQYLYYADRALQQDRGAALARLRALTDALPPDLGGPCWPDDAADPPVEPWSLDATDAAVDVLPRTLAALRREIPLSSPGAQLHVIHDGSNLEMSVAMGEARPHVPFSRQSLVPWNCCAKPQGAVAAMQLVERGLLDLDAPVTDSLSWFAGGRRESITVRQLLTHTTAVPSGFDPFHGRLVVNRAQRRELLQRVEPPVGERPGTRINYSAKWAWYLLAEIIEELDGRDYDQYVREEVLEPCGMTASRTFFSAEEYSEQAATLPVRYISGDGKPAQPSYWFSTERACTTSLPGASHRGPMSDLGRLLSMLLHDGRSGGKQVLSPDSVAALTSRQRVGLTDRYGNADWGLGVRVESRHLGPSFTQFSHYASARTFGHYGLWTNVGFADPDAGGLIVALHFNGQTWHEEHMARMFRVNDAIYEDLGLAG